MNAAGHQRGNLKFRKMNFVEQTVRYTLAGFKTELRCIFGTVSSVESVFSCRGRACVCWVAVFTNSIVTDAQTKIKQGLTNQHRALRYIYRRGARKERQERRETRKKGRKAAPLFAFRVTSTKTLINSLKWWRNLNNVEHGKSSETKHRIVISWSIDGANAHAATFHHQR